MKPLMHRLSPLVSPLLLGLATLSPTMLACTGDSTPPPAETAATAGEAATSSEATAGGATPAGTPALRKGAATEIAEAWTSALDEADNVDSVAFWSGALDSGEAAHWVLATAKETHRILVYDAATGELVRAVGDEGDGLGRFRHPNGVVAHGDLLWVAERDNHRVQILRLPSLEPVGQVGAESLLRPYGLSVVDGPEPGAYELYVTDSYEGPNEEPPPDAELDERVKQFRVKVGDDPAAGSSAESELLRAFGAVNGPGRLHVVESIYADPRSGRLLVAEEQTGDWSSKVYDLSGAFTGTIVGRGDFGDEAEGIALYPCGDDGYWILTDQREARTVFHVYDRRTLERIGEFSGALTANTDGVTATAQPLERFPAGVFFAVHDDQGVVAFDWRDIAGALALDACASNG